MTGSGQPGGRAEMEPPRLEVAGVASAYGRMAVLTRLDFALAAGQIGCLVGSSGCGKSTSLRCIAGLEPVTAGAIRIDGRVVSSPRATVPVERRGIGLVFQDYALFPHLSVAQNTAFGLQGLTPAQRRERVAETLALVGLDAQANALPAMLSGGQQQRAALARALAPRPRLLLLDEPFSNLDLKLRERLCAEVARILRESGTTALFVTHDQQEAFATADVIGVMRDGALLQWAAPETLFWEPATREVAEFIGVGSFLAAHLDAGGRVVCALGTAGGGATAVRTAPAGQGPPTVLVRPQDLQVTSRAPAPVGAPAGAGGQGERMAAGASARAAPTPARVVERRFLGAEVGLELVLGNGERVRALVSSRRHFAPGDDVDVRWSPAPAELFAPQVRAPAMRGESAAGR